MEKTSNCPVCNSTDFMKILQCKDYTVSQENFQVVSCVSCNFKFTDPRPEENKIGDYYKSEEYISHSNTNKGAINKMYQSVRQYTLKQKLSLINQYESNKKLLDIGCGTGDFLKTCSNAGWDVSGIEPDSNARKIACEMLSIKVGDEKELLKMKANSFGIISLWHVLEHVYHLNKRIEEIKYLLEENGKLIIAVPNNMSYDAEYYKEFWAAYDLPRHLYHFDPKSMEMLMKKHGFKIEKILPMKFDSFYVSLLSEKYKNGKVNYLNALRVGLKSNYLATKNKTHTFSSQIYIMSKI